MLRPRHEALIAMILAAAVSRLIPHPYNFAPIGALALFGGAQLPTSGWRSWYRPRRCSSATWSSACIRTWNGSISTSR